jgi:hypothetical protein
MFVIDDVSHADTSLEKLDELKNMEPMFVTDDVFHADTSAEKSDDE